MSYYEGVRRCKVCGRKFYSDCAEKCQRCFEAELYQEGKNEALVRISRFRLTIALVQATSWYGNW